mgnify:CR=1 FL=1
MEELLQFLISNLVLDKDAVAIKVTEKEDNYVDLLISVAEDDIGRVIGRQGKIINAVRTLAKAVGIKNGKKYSVEILNGEKKTRQNN